ncbi:MAG: protein kinase [Planctomycetes bacterium]|nr:protein kinase [Planctomycetota bacterium]
MLPPPLTPDPNGYLPETQDLPVGGSPGVAGDEILTGSRLLGINAFGPYAVIRVLAKGGMGAVFEVEHKELGARYALKTVLASPGSAGFDLQSKRFRREAELNARLDHPGILRVHTAALDEEIPYLVVDLLSGGSLGERLDEHGEIGVEDALALALPLAQALRHAHGRGVLHRDLKPENIMFDELGAPRLVDFGLALEVGRESRLTQSGTAVGTPLTMAPEQIRGERGESSATDVYGLAATIYWALTGDAPLGSEFRGLPDLIAAILARPVPPLRSVRPDVPRALADLIDASLLKEPGERPDFDRWIEILSLLRHSSGSGSAMERLGIYTTRTQRVGLLVLAASVILALLGALTAALLPDALPSPEPSVADRPAATPSPTPTRDWRAAFEAGASGEARIRLLEALGPLPQSEVELAGAVLASGPIPSPTLEAGGLDAFQLRIADLAGDERAALWSLACLAGDALSRARKHARRGSRARELIELEGIRAQVDQDEILPRLTSFKPEITIRSGQKAYRSLVESALGWNRRRVQSLTPLQRRLAGVTLDRLQWTIARLGFILLQSQRVHGSGSEPTSAALRVFRALPETLGVGRMALSLFLAGDQTSGNYPEHYRILQLAQAFEAELLSDPGGIILYGTHAVRYTPDPGEAIRLGILAREQTRSLGDLSRQAYWVVPRIVARKIELTWLGREVPRSPVRLERIKVLLAPSVAGKQRDSFPPRICWYLSLRELELATKVLEEAEQLSDLDPDNRVAFKLLRSEIELARNPAGAAQQVLERHKVLDGFFLEEWGLRAHAKALAGLDPADDLAELARRRRMGWRRLGLPWHAFDLPALLEAKVWWPGVPR